MSEIFQYKSSHISYHTFGRGDELLFAFHGYADTGKVFGKLTSFQDDYTIIAIDFPYHGATVWNEESLNSMIKAFIAFILKKYDKDKFCLGGASMGARIVFQLLSTFNAVVNKVFLFAPDGVVLHPLHKLTMTFSNQWISRMERWLAKPDGWLKVVTVLNNLKLLNRSHLVFLKRSLQSEERRTRLFGTWKILNELNYQISEGIETINKYQIATDIYLGNQDYTFPQKALKRFARKSSFIQIIIVDAGHDLIRSGI